MSEVISVNERKESLNILMIMFYTLVTPVVLLSPFTAGWIYAFYEGWLNISPAFILSSSLLSIVATFGVVTCDGIDSIDNHPPNYFTLLVVVIALMFNLAVSSFCLSVIFVAPAESGYGSLAATGVVFSLYGVEMAFSALKDGLQKYSKER